MKSRNLARLAVLASCACVLTGAGSALGVAPAAAQENGPASSPSFPDPSFPSCGCEPKFTIEKLQEIAGSGSGFTTSPLTGAIGQTVDYEILVTNTGHIAEVFSEFTDPQCDAGTIAGGPGGSPVLPGQSTTYTCNHVLTAVGSYTNEATVTGTPPMGVPVTQTSNQVVVEVPAAPAFTIEKLQKISLPAGTGSFTTATLTGATGETVEYQIVVKNTGNVPLALSGLDDAKCDPGSIAGGPAGGAALAPGDSTTFTCRHVLTGPGTYTNEATITGTPGGGTPITHTSNRVEVLVPGRPTAHFTIEKSQKIHGSAAGFTTSTLPGEIGQVVDYQIVVTNTGPVTLTFSGFADPQCDQGTIAGPPAEVSVAPGSSTTYTCSRSLPTNGNYVNQASVTGTAQGEAPVTETSNQVEVRVPAKGVKPCETSQPPFRGPTGPKRSSFAVRVSSAGVKQITFYLDGRKLRTLKHSQARRGKFTVTIDPRRLRPGRHIVTIKGTMADPVCGPFAQASSFTRPFSQSRPVFTG